MHFLLTVPNKEILLNMDTFKHSELDGNIGRIPPLNPVILRLLEQLNSGKYNTDDLRKIIEEDANTSVTVLKVANSPFYGMNRKINSIRDACVMLGFNNLRNIVYATALESFSSDVGPRTYRDALRQHTVASAIIAAQLAKRMRLEESTCYTLGLLHELGKQITMVGFPDFFATFITKSGICQGGVNDEILAMCNLGEKLAKTWHLPELFQHCIRYYVTPDSCPKQSAPQVQLIHIAHLMASQMGFPSPGETLVDEQREECMRYIEQVIQEPEIAELITRIEQALKQQIEASLV